MDHSANAIDDQQVILIEASGLAMMNFTVDGSWPAARAQTILANIRNSNTGEAARLADHDFLLEPVGRVS
jgi:hypothetical protein